MNSLLFGGRISPDLVHYLGREQTNEGNAPTDFLFICFATLDLGTATKRTRFAALCTRRILSFVGCRVQTDEATAPGMTCA